MCRSKFPPSARPVVPWCGQVDWIPRDAVALSVSRRVSRGCRAPNEVHGASFRRQHTRAASWELLDDPDLNASPRMRSCTCSS